MKKSLKIFLSITLPLLLLVLLPYQFSLHAKSPGAGELSGTIISHPEGLRSIFKGPEFIGNLLSELLPYVFILAGLFFFLNIILSGFKLLTSAGNPEGIQQAKGCLLTSIGGFLLILGSYWIAQIVQVVFNIKIVGK